MLAPRAHKCSGSPSGRKRRAAKALGSHGAGQAEQLLPCQAAALLLGGTPDFPPSPSWERGTPGFPPAPSWETGATCDGVKVHPPAADAAQQ